MILRARGFGVSTFSVRRPTGLARLARSHGRAAVAEKGHAALLQAFAELVASGANATLELLGDGPEAAHIEAQIRQLGLSERVLMRGQVPKEVAPATMAKANTVVLASFVEGLPVVLMEALAHGVPVVAPCVSGIPELAEHGVSSLTFPPAIGRAWLERCGRCSRTSASASASPSRASAAWRRSFLSTARSIPCSRCSSL